MSTRKETPFEEIDRRANLVIHRALRVIALIVIVSAIIRILQGV